jgi:hypothetical protein
MGLGRLGWGWIAVAGIAAIALVAWIFWPASQRGPQYSYVRPTIGSFSGATMWGTTISRRPRLDERAIKIALTNPHARAILGKRYRVTGDYSESNGVLLHVELLGKPRSYKFDLPYSTYSNSIRNPPADCTPPRYLVGWYHDVTRDVTGVALGVDLERRRLTDIMTFGIHVTSWAKGKPHPACPGLLNP